jgi:hypothetical protein
MVALKINKYFLLLICFLSVPVIAAEYCPGKVSEIMDHSNSALCGEGVAFRLTSTGNTYLCTISDRSISMVITAYIAGKTINPRLEPPTPGNCNSFSAGSYITPSHIRMHD